MAYEEQLQSYSAPVHADYSASQFLCGFINSSGRFQVATAGVAVDGILQDKPNAQGIAGCIGFSGVSKARAGGVVPAGSLLATDSTGRVVVASTGDNIIAKAMEAAGAANQNIAVLTKFQNTNAIA